MRVEGSADVLGESIGAKGIVGLPPRPRLSCFAQTTQKKYARQPQQTVQVDGKERLASGQRPMAPGIIRRPPRITRSTVQPPAEQSADPCVKQVRCERLQQDRVAAGVEGIGHAGDVSGGDQYGRGYGQCLRVAAQIQAPRAAKPELGDDQCGLDSRQQLQRRFPRSSGVHAVLLA